MFKKRKMRSVIYVVVLIVFGFNNSIAQEVTVTGSLKVTVVPSNNGVTDLLGVDETGAVVKKAISTIPINDADADSTNEIQQIEISTFNDTLRISGGDDFWILPGVSSANWAVDGSGNKYRVTKIGTQTWLRSNLRATKYNDGTPIPEIISDNDWINATSPAYCWYNNDSLVHAYPYGALYNDYVTESASNGGKNICPIGYHLPTHTEFVVLRTFLSPYPGRKLRPFITPFWAHWYEECNDVYHFTSVGSGSRSSSGNFGYLKDTAYYWTSSYMYSYRIFWEQITTDLSDVQSGDGLTAGKSIRCIKD